MHQKRISPFTVELFFHTNDKSRRGTDLYFKKLLVSKIVMHRMAGGGRWHHISVEKFFVSHNTEKTGRVTLLYFDKNLIQKVLMHRREYHAFFENFLSHRTEKLHSGSLCPFRSFLVFKKVLDGEERGTASRFSVEFFLIHIAKKICKGTLLCSEKLPGTEKFLAE